MRKIYTYPAFTLVEILVAMSILSVIIVSVLSIFLFSSQMSSIINLNRVTQENIKNVLDTISEEVRKEGIVGTRNFLASCSSFQDYPNRIMTGTILCLEGAEYALGKKDGEDFLPIDNQETYCANIENICYVIKKDNIPGGDWYPLTNSFLSFQKIDFMLSNKILPKLSIILQARPAAGKGLSADIVKNNIISIQTTISERLIETK